MASFQVEDKLEKARFFHETFLLADISIEVVLEMPFFTLSNADIQFFEKKLTWKSYIIAKALPTTKQIELIDKKKFVKAAVDENSETYVIYVATLEAPLSGIMIHLSQKAQSATLKQDEALIKVPAEYSDFSEVFSKKEAFVLSERTDLNEHAIKLEGNKQLSYRPIYSLGPVKLKIFKAYIETHLKTGFIRPSKSPAGALILFDKKLDGSF